MTQVWLPMAPGLPGAGHDDPQVAVIRCHCTRHLFLLLSRRHHPCKLPLPAMTFSPGTKKHPVPLPPPPPSSPLLPMQWPWSWKQKGEVWPGWGLPLSPNLPLAQPPWGCHTHPTLALCPGKAERKAQHSTQLELEVVLARLQPHRSQASEKGDSEALAEFHSNLF